MMISNGGVIINISSICADRGYPGLAVYSSTKGALNAFTRSLSRELGAANIRINCIAPGFFSSEMSDVLSENQMRIINSRTPTGRLCEPNDVVRACDIFLDADLNITGQVFAVDGGAAIA